MRLLALFSLLLLVACGGGKSVKKPSWVAASSGVVEDEGKWYYGVESAKGKSPLERRHEADKKAKENVVGACKDVKAEDAEVVDHWVDGNGNEFALARIDASKCPDAAGAGGAKKEEKAEEKKEEKPAEEKPAEEKPAEEKPAEEKPAE